MSDPDRFDQWDVAARRAASRDALVHVASAFLRARNDQALGLAPARFLPSSTGPLWILYWCAARRVDDSIEQNRTHPDEWLRRVASPGQDTLAERCVEELRTVPALQAADIDALLTRSLEGVDRERQFDRPRPWSQYMELLDLKSTPTMEVFDALLAPAEDPTARTLHAKAFAASAQIGDDCRDALRDLQLGRCFITLDELGDQKDPGMFAKTEPFAIRRTELCRTFLQDAQRAASRFRSPSSREGAGRLHAMWSQAIESGQIRPTAEHLALPP